MKHRAGFVSNSSSSSFICLGTENADTISNLLKAEGLVFDEDQGTYPEQGGGVVPGKIVNFINPSDDGSIQIAGITDDRLVEILKNSSLEEAKIIVQEIISDKLGVFIPVEEMIFDYGETSDNW